jgi:hypothetical protein
MAFFGIPIPIPSGIENGIREFVQRKILRYAKRKIKAFLFPSIQDPGLEPNQIAGPTASEDRYIPELIGLGKPAMNLIAMGNKQARPIRDGGVTIGRAYFINTLWAVAANKVDSVTKFYRNDIVVGDYTTGPKTGGANWLQQTGARATDSGSGVGPSRLFFYDGTQTSIDSTAATRVGDGGPYTGVALLYTRGTPDAEATGTFIGDNVASLPFWGIECQHVSSFDHGAGWGSEEVHAASENAALPGHANPANVLYWYIQRSRPGDSIDVAAFKSASTTLATEKFGVSFTIDSQSSVGELMDKVTAATGAFVYRRRSDAAWTIKLERNDYDAASLATIDESSIGKFKTEKLEKSTLPTDFSIRFTSRDTYKVRSFNTPNDENRDARQGSEDHVEFDATVLLHEDFATQTNNREFVRRTFSYNFGEFTMPSSEVDFDVGDVRKIDYAPDAISGMIIRIKSIEDEERGGNTVSRITFAEDIYNIGAADLGAIPAITPVDQSYNIVDALPQLTVLDATPEQAKETTVQVLAASPGDVYVDGVLVTVDGEFRGEVEVSPYATLSTALSGTTDEVGEALTFSVENATGWTEATNDEDDWFNPETVLLLTDGTDFEIIAVKEIADDGSNEFTVTGLIRGIAGTEQIAHSIGAQCWILPEGVTSNLISVKGKSLADLSIGATPYNAFSQGPQSTDSHVYGYTAETPYQPVESVISRGIGALSDIITLKFTPRSRGGTEFAPDSRPASDRLSKDSFQYIEYEDGQGELQRDATNDLRSIGSAGDGSLNPVEYDYDGDSGPYDYDYGVEVDDYESEAISSGSI